MMDIRCLNVSDIHLPFGVVDEFEYLLLITGHIPIVSSRHGAGKEGAGSRDVEGWCLSPAILAPLRTVNIGTKG